MKTASLIFPHQLFETNPILERDYPIFLIEEYLFFSQYPFHKQKLAFHRASMKCYAHYLTKNKKKVQYIQAKSPESDIRRLIPFLKEQGYNKILYIDPTDYLLDRRIKRQAVKENIDLEQLPNPSFINSKADNSNFFKPTKKKFFQTSFYKEQRERLSILLNKDGGPEGGKWSFDGDNRKKYPAKKTPPAIKFPKQNSFYLEAIDYVNQHFQDNYGSLSDTPLYPIDHQESSKWLEQFLQNRFEEFGDYEDAIVKGESILNHSVLSPLLNTGLITPKDIIQKTISYYKKNNIPLNSTEGFVRQIIGWREFIRGIYEVKGTEERTSNYWGFDRKIPKSFYNGTTGIDPLDEVIKEILKTGYCHHIERLMVLGNFMLLCEFDPNEVYQWFMELFIDAYDWVMVPNVYGMSQFADGGLFATKPYISGSNYILKMSNYSKGEWQKTWDGLFWRFMDVHRDFFNSNPRLGMLVRTFDKMEQSKKQSHHIEAEKFLKSLYNIN